MAISPGHSHSAAEGPGFNCSNPRTSVESAICGNAELAKLYRQSQAAYRRVKAKPAAFDIMLNLMHSRRACIIWMPGEPYQAGIKLAEEAALKAYKKLEAKPKRKHAKLKKARVQKVKHKKAKRKHPLRKASPN